MEMGRPGNGGGKVVTFDDAVLSGRRRSGGGGSMISSSYLDVGSKDAVEAGRGFARPLPAPGMGSRRRTYADGELDVFTAERYFKGAMDGGDRREAVAAAGAAAVAVRVPPLDVETAAAGASARPAGVVVVAWPSSTRASTASFTASSASSVNSQTALVRGGHRRRGRRCCVQVGVLMRTCSGKRSVRVDGGASREARDAAVGEPAAASRIDWYRELRMQKAALGLVSAGDGGNNHGVVAAGLPPGLNLGTAKVAAIGREEKAAELTFSSSARRSVALVAPVRANVLPASGRAGIGGRGDDNGDGNDCDDDGAGSESSSDLFEIKSLMIEDCRYEPSEASIQWSVVTASATDASEPRGDRVPARWVGGGGDGRGPVGGRQHGRDHRPVGLLAGCASQRAVDVSAATRAVPNTAVQRRGDAFQKARHAGA
jgi:hypothetical protein